MDAMVWVLGGAVILLAIVVVVLACRLAQARQENDEVVCLGSRLAGDHAEVLRENIRLRTLIREAKEDKNHAPSRLRRH